MIKKIVMIHGYEGAPEEGWKPWLKKTAEEMGFNIQVLAMPNPFKPRVEEWVNKIKETVGKPDKNTILVGHSLGCIAALRYLETINVKIRGTILVAGFTSDLGWENLKNFFKTNINWGKIKCNCDKFVAIHSDNDKYVSLHYADIFEDELNAKIVVEHNKGHFDQLNELPILMDELKLLL